MRFVDSHLHLDHPEAPRVILSAAATGTGLFACGVDRESSSGVLSFARGHPGVKAFVGVHPSEAAKSPDLGWLEGAAASASGVGEIGLDGKYSDPGPGTAQATVFEGALGVAKKLGKPAQVHSRGSEMRCLELIAGTPPPRVLMHWLASEEALPVAMERGHYVSFGPALLYSKRLQRMATRADPSMVLTESDSPVPYTPLGGAAGPSLIPTVVFRLSELWGEGFEEARERVSGNASRFLTGSEKG